MERPGYVTSMLFTAQAALKTAQPAEIEKAQHLFEIAIKYYNSPEAKVTFARELLYNSPDQFDLAINLLKEAVDQGFEEARVRLGIALSPFSNIISEKKNPEEAFNYLSVAAEKGSELAMYHLSKFYANGVCVEKDPKKTQELYDKAKEKLNIEEDKTEKSFTTVKNMLFYGFILFLAIIFGLFYTS